MTHDPIRGGCAFVFCADPAKIEQQPHRDLFGFNRSGTGVERRASYCLACSSISVRNRAVQALQNTQFGSLDLMIGLTFIRLARGLINEK
jgi:hypothetical protein